MRSATGKVIFFDRVAEGLQSFFGGPMPKRLGLTASDPRFVPEADLKALARALCRLHDPRLDAVPEFSASTLAPKLSIPAAVFNCEQRPLEKCLDDIEALAEIVVAIGFTEDGTDFPRCTYNPVEQSDIVSDALSYLFKECNVILSQLARVRFEARGFAALEHDFSLFTPPQTPSWEDPHAVELFFARLSRAWVFNGRQISAEHIARWVRQFEGPGFATEAKQLLLYLHQNGFVTENAVIDGILQKHADLYRSVPEPPIAISIQKPGKSEQKIAYRLKPTIELQSLGSALVNWRRSGGSHTLRLVCFDDCIGSGESIERNLFESDHNQGGDDLVELFDRGEAHLDVISYYADQRGIDRIQKNPKSQNAIIVHPVRLLDESHRVFSATSRILKDSARRIEFETFCREIGEKLFPGQPLGWENGQWCITYDYTIPDNTLPILYSRLPDDSWIPLFERNR